MTARRRDAVYRAGAGQLEGIQGDPRLLLFPL